MATTHNAPAHNQRQSIPTTTALAVAPSASSNQIVQYGMTRDQLDLLKRTLAKGTTDDEFALFMSTAHRLGLDPFARQIFAVKRWDSKEEREVMSIQVSIDGFRVGAMRTNEVDGQEGPFWCGDDGVWVEAWLHEAPPAAAKVIVYRKGCSRPFVGVAAYRSYVQTKRDGKPNNMWSRGPDFMLAKCAEALALRKAFPAELGGVTAPEEVDDEAETAAQAMTKLPDVSVVKAAPTAAKPANAAPPQSAPAAKAPVELPAMTAAEADEIAELLKGAPNESELKALYKTRIAPRAMDNAQRDRLGAAYADQLKLIREAAQAEREQAAAQQQGGVS